MTKLYMSSGFKGVFRRHPRLPSILLFLLWLTLISYWSMWEAKRKSKINNELNPLKPKTVVASDFTFVYDESGSGEVPSCPFAMNNYYFKISEPTSSNTEAEAVEAEPEPVLPREIEEDIAEPLRTFKYRGLMRTRNGECYAFIEDENGNSTIRLKVGDAVGQWHLDAISKHSVIFSTDGAETFEILRFPENEETLH